MSPPVFRGDPPPPLPGPPMGPVGAVIGAVRLALALVWLAAMTALYAVLKGLEPLSGGARPRYAVMRLWARVMLRLLGVRRIVHGTPMPRGGAFVANHASWLDIIALCSIGRVVFLPKAEVAHWPGIGWCARLMDALFVERRASAAARQREDMAQRIARGQQLLFFPEGTSTDAMRVLPFKSALFAVFFSPEFARSVPVQPVSVTWNAPRRMPSSFYGWWGDMALEPHVWQVVTRSWGGAVHLDFGPPLLAHDFADRKALARAAEAHVSAAFAAHKTRPLQPSST